MADKIAVLRAGHIEQVGSPLELYRTPRNLFVAGFVGSPKMNHIDGPEAVKPNAHTIGIRPEHLGVSTTSGTWKGRVGVSDLGSDTFDYVHDTGLSDDMTARGIGRAFAQAYIAEGATVVIADINLDAAQATADELGDAAYGVHLDVADQVSIDAAIAAVVGCTDKLDIVINNAALFDAAETVDITRVTYDRLFAVNASGTLFTMQAAARQMIAQGHGGKIINMASQAERRGEALVLVYCATKAAVISMTQSAGLDLIRHGINVNAIAPGVVDGDHWDHVDSMFAKLENKKPDQKKAEVAASVPAGRFATPADLTGMAIFLAFSEANYIVAQTYNVDGGQWMG